MSYWNTSYWNILDPQLFLLLEYLL